MATGVAALSTVVNLALKGDGAPLEVRFGASYLEYKSRTPMLFPRKPK